MTERNILSEQESKKPRNRDRHSEEATQETDGEEKMSCPKHEHCWHEVKVNHFYGDWQVCCKCGDWRLKKK